MYCLTDENDLIIQIQPNEEENFIECPDNAVVGMIWNGVDLTTPVINKTLEEVVSAINAAMFIRIDQGIKWAWSAQEPEYSISLNPGMREILSSWHSLLNQSTPAINPHGGFIKSNGVIIKGPGNNDLPDTVINEIAEFSGLWVSEISRISIVQDTAAESMTQTQLNDYNAGTIDWTVTWVGHSDWINDLVLYNP